MIDRGFGTNVEPFNFKVQPFPGDEITDKALSVSGTTREQIATYKEHQNVYWDLSDKFDDAVDKYKKTDKMFFVGFNAIFDMNFMFNWFEKCGDAYFGSYFFYPPIDVAVLAGHALMDRRAQMKDFKLATVAQELDIRIDKTRLHDAMYDIELTRDIYRTLFMSRV